MIHFGSWISDHGNWVQKWSPQGIDKSWICLKIGYANPKWDVFCMFLPCKLVNLAILPNMIGKVMTNPGHPDLWTHPDRCEATNIPKWLWLNIFHFFWAGLLQIVPLEFTIYWPFGSIWWVFPDFRHTQSFSGEDGEDPQQPTQTQSGKDSSSASCTLRHRCWQRRCFVQGVRIHAGNRLGIYWIMLHWILLGYLPSGNLT